MLTGVAIVFFLVLVLFLLFVLLFCFALCFFFNRNHTNWSPGRVLEEKGKENLLIVTQGT